MSLDPYALLSRETVEAIEDFVLPRQAVPPPSERTLRRMSLGIAAPDEIGSAAGFLVRSHEARERLVALHRDAPGFVKRQAEEAAGIDRLISEGRWIDACSRLGFGLEELRMGWEGASALGLDESVASLVASLSGPLMETGAEDELSSLAEAGFAAAKRLGRPMLRARMLSMLAVLASRRGDSAEATRLWGERFGIARSEGDLPTMADALIDLAGQSFEDGDHEECLRLVAEAEGIAIEAGRTDLAANAWGYRATVALRRGDPDTAVVDARRALQLLTGAEGYDVGLSVRVGAVRTLLECGWTATALGQAASTLSMSVESGKPSGAAIALGQAGEALGTLGESALAERCLALSLRLHREVGTRFVERAETRLARIRASAGLDDRELSLHPNWEVEAAAILAQIDDVRERSGATR